MITLEEITRDNIHAVLGLEGAERQLATFSRSNGYSIAEGFFPPNDDPVWMRAISEDGDPVGFMTTSEVPERGAYYLSRFIIDHCFQDKGYGEEAMRLLIKRIVEHGKPQVLLLSHLEDNAGAGAFYRSLGFSYPGNDLGGPDLEMSLKFE